MPLLKFHDHEDPRLEQKIITQRHPLEVSPPYRVPRIQSTRRPILFILLLATFATSCQTAPPKPITTETRIEALKPYESEEIPPESTLLYYSGLYDHQVGYFLFDPAQKKMISQHNTKEVFFPASVSKLLTVYAAQKVLGRKARILTSLESSGEIHGSRLKGDLYLVGRGDPGLTTSDLMGLVYQLKRKGIRKIDGHFYYDESQFEAQKAIDLERNQAEAYNPAISALSLEFNNHEVSWEVDRDQNLSAYFTPAVGMTSLQLATCVSNAPLSEISEQNSLSPRTIWRPKNQSDISDTSAFSEQSEISRLSDCKKIRSLIPSESVLQTKDIASKSNWFFPDTWTRSGNSRIPIRHPARYAALVFQKLARLEGIQMKEPEPKARPKAMTILASHQSPTLERLGASVLEYSNNLAAELLFLSTAKALAKNSTSGKTSSEILTSWWKNEVFRKLKIKPSSSFWKGFFLKNGSGLTTENQITPEQMLALLRVLNGEAEFSPLYQLPISGLRGTLSSRLRSPDAALQVWAKTGTLSFASSLAGVLYSHSGRRYLFGIFSKDLGKRKEIENYDWDLPNGLHRESRRWGQKAHRLQDKLLLRWLQKQ